MKVLAIRTDKPAAELYLFEGDKQLAEIKWHAHRELAETIHLKIKEILNKSSISYKDLDGIVIFKGPGSFTGLRIGFSVANALAYAQDIPIAAAGGDNWIEASIDQIKNHPKERIALPDYGSPAHTTKPRK